MFSLLDFRKNKFAMCITSGVVTATMDSDEKLKCR